MDQVFQMETIIIICAKVKELHTNYHTKS